MGNNQSKPKFLIWVLIGTILLIGFLLFKINSLQNPLPATTIIPKATGAINLWAIFLTGLLTGGLTCLAVQGGLLAATIAQREEEQLKEKAKKGAAVPIAVFVISKLIAYTLLGFLLGLLGSVVQLSLTARIIIQFAVAVFMIGTALNILNAHPIFRYFVIQPPKFLTRLVRNQSKSKSIFAPAILGVFTVFIPCGTTQAMMALAIGAGNPLLGATILFAFVLGTSPVFFILGYFATRLGDTLHQKFMRVAAFAIILLAIFNINNAIALTGSSFTLENLWNSAYCTLISCNGNASSANAKAQQEAVQTATITIENNGYTPTLLTIKAGSLVKLHLNNTGGSGCVQTFTIPQLGIQQSVPLGTQSDITFTAPSKPGQLPFMCSMGMYRGMINVI